jgi:ribosomal protein S4E
MGKIRVVGDTSGKEFQIVEEVSGELKFKNASDGIDLFKVDSTTITDAGGVQLSSHNSRHAYGGADALAADSLRYSQVKVVYGTEQTVNVGAGSTSTISEGLYIARTGANTTVEYSPDGGTTWVTLVAAGSAGVIASDGTNCRFNNAGGAAENSYLTPIE